jgi:hypothetical protein
MKKLLPLVLLLAVGCSSFARDTNRTLLAFEAAYKIEEPVRAVFCKDRVPQPPACVDAQKAAKAGYAAYQEASKLFAAWLDNKSADLRTALVLLVPQIVASTIELTSVISELK